MSTQLHLSRIEHTGQNLPLFGRQRRPPGHQFPEVVLSHLLSAQPGVTAQQPHDDIRPIAQKPDQWGASMSEEGPAGGRS